MNEEEENGIIQSYLNYFVGLAAFSGFVVGTYIGVKCIKKLIENVEEIEPEKIYSEGVIDYLECELAKMNAANEEISYHIEELQSMRWELGKRLQIENLQRKRSGC